MVEVQAIEDYVVEHKGLDRELVEELAQAEAEYMEENGFTKSC